MVRRRKSESMMDHPYHAPPDQVPVILNATSSPSRHRILIVDDMTAKCEAFRIRLSEAARDFVIEGMSDPRVTLGRKPDLVMWILADQEAGPENLRQRVRRLNERFPSVPIVAVSLKDDVQLALRVLRLGFRGYVSATLDPRVAAAGLRLVLAGGIFVPDCVLDVCSDNAPCAPHGSAGIGDLALTGREMDVLHRIKRGLQNKIIAYELGISQSTVKVHVRSIMRKTAATNRTQVAYLTRQLPSETSRLCDCSE